MKTPRHGCLRALVLLLLLLAALVATGAYLYRDKLLSRAQERILCELEKDRLFVGFTLEPGVRLNAITLRDLTFYRDSQRKEPGATLDHLSLQLAVVDSLRQGTPHIVVSTRNAKFVVFTPDDPVVWENLSFTYRHSAGARVLEEFQGSSRGVELQASARWEVPPKRSPAASLPPAPPAPEPLPPSTPLPPAGETPAVSPTPQPEAPLPSRLDVSSLVAFAKAMDYRNAGFEPKLSFQVNGKNGPNQSNQWTLTGNSRSFPSRGVDLRLDASWTRNQDETTVLNGVTLAQGDRQAQFEGTYRKADKVFEIGKFDSTLDWTGILQDFPTLKEDLAKIQTTTPPLLTIRGKHHLGQPEQSDLALSVSGWALNYQARNDRPPLTIQGLQMEGTLQEGTLQIPSYQAKVAEGDVTGEATISPFAEKPAWSGRFDANNLALARLAKPSGRFPAEGLVQLSFAGSGSSGTETLQGQGHLEISNGKFLDVNVLGSLLRYLERVSPGLGAGVSDQVRGSFLIQDGVLQTNDLLLEVSASKVAVQGQVNLTSRQTSLEARANLRGLLSAITESLTEGQGLVIEGTGPVDKINWRLKKPGKATSAPASPPSDSTTQPDTPAAQGSGSLKDQIKQQAMDSLLDGTAEEAVGNLLQGIKERRAIRRQEREAITTPPQN